MALPPAYHQSLPYADAEPPPPALAGARALVAAEVAGAPRPGPAPARPVRFSPAVAAELARVAAGAPAAPLPLDRYEAPGPAPATALRPALLRARAAAAYLATRRCSLALLAAHGPDAWLLANYHAERAVLRPLEAALAATRRRIDLLNARRAAAQRVARPEMDALDARWRRAVARVLETELAVEQLRAQIRDELKARSARGDHVP